MRILLLRHRRIRRLSCGSRRVRRLRLFKGSWCEEVGILNFFIYYCCIPFDVGFIFSFYFDMQGFSINMKVNRSFTRYSSINFVPFVLPPSLSLSLHTFPACNPGQPQDWSRYQCQERSTYWEWFITHLQPFCLASTHSVPTSIYRFLHL